MKLRESRIWKAISNLADVAAVITTMDCLQIATPLVNVLIAIFLIFLLRLGALMISRKTACGSTH